MNVKINGFPFPDDVISPSSKSFSQRCILCAAFADKPTIIYLNNFCDDVNVFINAIVALGATVDVKANSITVHPIDKAVSEASVNCGESGAALRFLLPVAAALGVKTEFIGKDRLFERPSGVIIDILRNNGCSVELNKNGIILSGRLLCDRFDVDSSISSQYVSGLIFASAFLGKPCDIRLTGDMVSFGYVKMTAAVLRLFGAKVEINDDTVHVEAPSPLVSPEKISVEGDWSAAAFFMVSAAISKKKPIVIHGLSADSIQGDKEIVSFLRKMGSKITYNNGIFTVFPSELREISVNMEQCPDLVPPLAIAACVASGTSVLSGIERLTAKESDRLASLCGALSSLGAEIKTDGKTLTVTGKTRLFGGKCLSYGDHRIAMAAASLASVCANPVEISDFECVSKSFPDFFELIKRSEGR